MNSINLGVSPETVKEVRAAIMDILNCSVQEETKRVALSILVEITQVRDITISGNTFTMTAPPSLQYSKDSIE